MATNGYTPRVKDRKVRVRVCKRCGEEIDKT